MNCQICSKVLLDDWKYCPECGTSLKGEATDKVVERRKGALGLLFSSGPYGAGVRQQVFEVIVRQAVAGQEWRDICAQPLATNKISVEEVEAEVERRRGYLH